MKTIIDGNNFTLIAASTLLKVDPNLFEDCLYDRLVLMISSLQRKLGQSDYYVVWDTYGGTSFRKEIDPNYKATRNYSLFDYKAIDNCKSVYEEFDIKSIKLPTCEGDDAIFSLCKYLREKYPREIITIVSRDHDMIQIVQKGYCNYIYDPCKKDMMTIPWYDIVKYKALVGDSSDNIKGVLGIGPKTALKILTGQLQLNENQKQDYEKALKIIDSTLNPNYNKNNEEIKRIMESLENE